MRKQAKRVSALMLTLTMLVSMMAVMGAFPVAAASATMQEGVEKFTANFSALPQGEVAMTDAATVKYLEDRFAFFYFQQGWWFQRSDVNGYTMNANGEYLTGSTVGISYMPDVVGQKAGASNSEYVDGTGKNLAGRGISRWLVGGKYLAATAYAKNETAFYKVNSMWVKGDDGDLAVLDNFNLEMDFKPADTALYNGITTNMDSVAVWFRAKSAGQAYGAADHQMVSIAPDGGLHVGKLESGMANAAYAETMQYNGAAVTLSRSKEYHMSLTVIGTEMNLVVTDNATDKVVYLLTRAVEDMEAGYLGIGGSTAGAYYGNIEITRLDKDGNAVDFNDHNDGYGFGADFARITDYRQKLPVNTAGSWSYNDKGTYLRDNGANVKWLDVVNYNDNTYDFSKPDEYAADKAVVDYLSSKFDFVYNRETELTTFATPYENSNTQDPDSQYGAGANAQWKLQDGRYLNAIFNKQGGETFRKTVSLVPKDRKGNQITAKNLETEFDMVLGTTAKTGLAFSFRAGVGGRFTTGYKTTTADRITVVFTSGGYKVYEGVMPKDETVTPVVNAWADGATVTKAHVYIKVVGTTLTMKVTGMDGTVYYAGATELTYTAEGKLFYSVLNGTGGFANIRASRLDEAGNEMPVDAGESLATNINVSTRPSYTITAGDGIAEQLDAMFNAYYDIDGTLTKTGGFPTTATTGARWASIYERVYLECSTTAANKVSALKAVGTLVPKTADGKEAVLKNFELSFTTRWAEMTFNNASVGGVVIGFRQQTAGKITTASGKVNKNQGLIVITSTGISIAGGDEITDAMYGTANEQTFASELNPKASSNLSYHNVKVRVVGNQVTVTIDDKTYTDTINYDEAGYLAFGAGAFRMHFGNLKFTRLDDVGNAIDWNADQYESIPSKVVNAQGGLLGFNTKYANKYPNNSTAILLNDTSLTVAQREEFLDFMDGRFDVYYNDNDGTYVKGHSVAGNKVGYNYDEMMYYKHNWLRPNAAASGYGEIKTNALEDIGSLVFKDDDGEQLYLKNLQIDTAFENEGTSAIGSNFIAIRQETPGRYFNADGSLANGTFVQFSNGYVYVYENGVKIHEQYCAAAKPASIMQVKIRVVGNQLTYTLTSLYNTGGPYTGTVTLSTADEGYVAFSQNNWRQFFSLSATTITALDDAGNEAPIKKPASSNKNGNIAVNTTVKDGVYTNKIVVTPEEGYELKAGSLIAIDAEGNRYVPTRVGFRNGGNANEYVVMATSPVKVTATFIQPTTADPNIGNIGTSINDELYGLRFVSRFNRTVEDGVEYVILDGEKYPVKDYGMIVGLEMVVGTDILDLELVESNRYVQKASVYQQKKYFDRCDDYVDMSVCVTNMHKLPDGLELDVIARPYVIVDDGSEEGMALYAKQFTSNYEENAGLSTVSFAELIENDQLIVHGRAGLVGEEYQMDWVNTGFEVKGELMGSVRLNTVSTRTDSLLNVVIDGGKPTVVHVPKGSASVALATNLEKGEHTIQVISGTSVRQGNLSATDLQYIGTLDTVKKDDSKLRITVFGDSISCGWGMGILNGGSYTAQEQINGSNSYYSYASIAARELDANLDVVALCSQTISEIHKYASLLNRRSGAPAWDWEEQDIVIVNLGTNDEWRSGFTPETALKDATALLEDVREINPDAYIIYVYSMMTDYTQKYQDYLVSYKAAVQSLVDKGDNKVFMLQMTPNRNGYEGHPDTEAHAAYADVLVEFIKEKCGEHFGHTTHTETIGALKSANKLIATDRTTASGNSLKMTYSNTGVTLQGYFYGDLKMNVNVAKEVCALDVIVDGELANTVWVNAGDSEVTLLENFRRGNYTIEIVKGTAHHAGELTMKGITYTGTLATPTAKDLQMLFIGDSVTVGEGMYGDITPLAQSYNSFDGYAAQVARYFGAQVTTVAQCGAKIPGMTTQFNAAQDAAKDIVVINLGTNDFGWSSLSGLDIKNDYYPSGTTDIKVKDAITGLIEDVRAAHPDAYIIWTYGMMFDLHLADLEDIIEEHAAATNDDKLMFCNVAAAKDNSGKSSHPSTVGNNNAALVLTGFIRENCADVLPSVPEVQKTYATDRALKVACVGDSITALKYWDNNMRGELSAENYTVSGFGVSGSTAGFKGVDYVDASTNAGKAYVDQSAYKDALAYNADIVVIMLGTNDSKKVNWPVYADEFVANYVEIVRSFQNQKNAPKVFIGLPPTVYSTGSFQDISNSRIENFIIPALYEVAAQTGAVIVDTHTPTGGDSTLMSDGVHPTDAGKQILCETFAAAIKADTGRQ